jgi:multiple sugar transport system substrate-binding protein
LKKPDGGPTVDTRSSRRTLLRNAALITGGIAAAGVDIPFGRPALAQRSGEKVKLRMQTWFSDTDMQDWQVGLDMVRQMHPDIEVAIEFAPYNDTVTRTLVAATAGDLPDIIMCSTDHTPSLATNGVLADLNPYIAKDGDVGPDDFAHGVAQGFNMWGRWWGFPYDVSTFGIYYNKSMFDAAGVPYPPSHGKTPWTWDQFIEAAKKLTKPNGRQWGVTWESTPLWDNYLTSNFIYGAGGRNFDDERRHCIIHSEEAAAGIQFMADLIHKHKVSPTPAELAGSSISYFESGLSAMMLNGQWRLGQTKRNVDFPFDISYFPRGKVQKLATGGSGFAMSSATKHPEQAWQFLKSFTSKDVLSKMIGGTGRGIPARLSASQSYIDSAPTPNAAIFVEQLAISFNDRSVLGYPQFADVFNQNVEPLYQSGDGSMIEALARVQDAGNKSLDQQWSKVKIDLSK